MLFQTPNNIFISLLNDIKDNFNYIISPPTCLICENLIEKESKIENLIINDANKVTPHSNLLCDKCYYNLPFIENFDLLKAKILENFSIDEMFVDHFYSLLSRDRNENVTNIIYELKYSHRKIISKLIAELMYPLIKNVLNQNNAKNISNTYDYLLPVPIHNAKLRERGFNQSELIANELSKLINIPVNNEIIKKVINNQTQTKLGKKEREKNVSGVFDTKNIEYKNTQKTEIEPQKKPFNFLIIDDVLTTGSTVTSIAKILKQNYNCAIDVLTLIKA